MENQQDNLQQTVPQKNILFQVTPFSKAFAGVLFVGLPFLGLWVGMQYPSSAIEAVPVQIVQAPAVKDNSTLKTSDAGVDEETKVGELSDNVLVSLVNEDLATFAKLLHPVEGVRFSFDGHVKDDDVKLTASQIEAHIQKNDLITWGLGDGSGLPINKTFTEWFSDYSKIDYTRASDRTFNKVLGGDTTAINNIASMYAKKPFMSYYLPSTGTYLDENGKEVPQPMSWKAINLVFDTYNNQLYLIGILTENGTI